MKATQLTAASYSRFSTKHQKDTSIEDQEALNDRTAERYKIKIVAKYADRAKSGRSRFGREQLDDLVEAIKRREFDAVIVENIDRLTRDNEDLHHILKRMKFAGMKLYTQSGVLSDMEAALKGTISAEFIKDLIDKIKRGLDGRVRKGLFPGAVTYGYDRVQLAPATYSADGVELQPVVYDPGVRIIFEKEAEIVCRIFREYASGVSPRAIAMGLTRDGIPAPSGAARWSHQTLIGGTYGRGMLGNRLYIGEIVWNTHATVKSPYTFKDVKQPRDEGEHIVQTVPDLRIIDQDLWDRVQALRQQRAQAKFGPTGKVKKRNVVDRGTHLLSGLLRCSVCNGAMRIKGKNRVGHSRVTCAAAYTNGSCEHSKSYDIEELKAAAFDQLKALLKDEEALGVACRESVEHFKRITKEQGAKNSEITRKLTNVKASIERAARAIVNGTASPTLEKMLTELEIERGLLEQQLGDQKKVSNIAVFPNVVSKVIETTSNLHRLLMEGKETAELRANFRAFVHTIDVVPTPKRMGYKIRTSGRLAAMLGDNLPAPRSNEKILEIEGLAVAPTATRHLPRERHTGRTKTACDGGL